LIQIMHPRLAHIISTVGNPFLLFPAVISYIAVEAVGLEAAKPLMITLASIFAILSLFLLVRKLRGEITNLDVSDRKQRAVNVYLPSIGMVLAAALYFKWSNQPYLGPTLYVGLMLATCFGINSLKKISLHTVMATYLCGLLLTENIGLSFAVFGFSILIAWSRVVLGRHTTSEVVLGWFVGTAFGLLHIVLF
jgi:membrane-associated phospholipid phosphatase